MIILSFLNLQGGFPLGHMPPLLHTVILPNNPSILPHMDFIEEYLRKELLVGRMSGPFSSQRDGAHLCVVRSNLPLSSSRFNLSIRRPDKLRVCRHLSKSTKAHPP